MLQTHQTMAICQQAHLLHGQQVVVDGAVRALVNGRQLVLGRCHFVVLRLGGNAKLPQLLVKVFHVLVDRRADGAEVMLLELLALARRIAEQRAVREHEVEALLVRIFRNQEVLLLATDCHLDMPPWLAEQCEYAVELLFDDIARAQQRRLLVKRLARVAAKRRGDAEHFVLDERVTGRVPRRVAARLERCAQSAIGEARRIGLALDELLAAEAHERTTVGNRIDETVVFLGGDAGERLEPMRVVRRALLDGPFLHRMRHDVGNFDVERLSPLDGAHERLVRDGWQPFGHNVLVEYERAVDFRNV